MAAALAHLPVLAAGLLASVAALVLYRLCLHPLARFPGPRLAAVTSWYEGFYEIVKNGQYSRKISKLHDEYGPIIRVAPHELHIRDSRFFEEFYAKNLHLDKEGWDVRFGTEGGVLTTVNAACHKRRRAALSPMFSRRSILDFIHIIYRHIDTLSIRMQEFEARKEPINLTHAFPALTGDIIMDYFFGFNYAQLKHPEFESFHDAFQKIGGAGHIATQFPLMIPMMNAIPDALTEWLQPAAKNILRFRRDQWNNIRRTMSGESVKTNDAKKTIFQEILQSKLPDEDKTQKRLAEEAQIVVGGGVETTAFSLCIATFHIINTPRIYKRLHADLVAAFPNRSSLELYPLEQMPYLKACIMEAVRLSYGLSARNPRTRRTMPLQYKDWTIPPNTNVSMTIPEVSHDESIFPNSHEYIPERWLGNPIAPDGLPLERYLVSFGRGTRSCMGINLAWTELYLILGMLFRRYKFELHEPSLEDVQLGHDFFIPVTKLDARGVRVFVESVDH
ncbi:cytochrome P450 [Didymella exigua CBS 183.55]|uniref:Cytochrome P450 n=1 Tax=Didymella exigua CBS 183.55 TaxID=1150837 RepID=A0A6A5RSZ8_9PLEO|nr:cytochrome P450 [Didymella exigua CBS 183.55]KAF1931555.1 cytochrome P450 [Didymella exigua CBS 183.55]